MTAHLRNTASHNENLPLIIMIAASVLVHVLLFGSSMIAWIRPLHLPDSHIISVKLAQHPSLSAPDTHRLGMDNNQGSGNTRQPHQQASHRLTNTPSQATAQPEAATPTPQQTPQAHTLHSTAKNAPALPAPTVASSEKTATPVTTASLLSQVDNLSSVQQHGDVAMQDNSLESGQQNGSGDSTHRYEWARYQTDWRLRIERIGNLNYPEEARRQNVHGSVTLEVTVAADGRLLKCRLLRSSGHGVLDNGALHIVQMSAPFSPFPPSLARQGAKVIVQTFAFTRDNQLASH